MITHYGLFRESVPQSPMIKTADYFLILKENSRRDHPKDDWWKSWEPIHDCETIGDARRKLAEKYGVKLSHIYWGEK